MLWRGGLAVDWFKMSATVALDPKIRRLSVRARWAFVEIIAQCALLESDGDWYAEGALPAYYFELIGEGLVEEVAHPHYRVPAYLKWNPSKAELQAKRDAARDRQRKSRGMSRRDFAESSRAEVEVEERRTEQPTSTRAKRVKRETKRERNPLIDALAEIEGADPSEVPPARWRTLGTKLAEIQKATPDVTVEEIHRRAANFPKVMPPHTTLTAPALATHWARCAGNGHDPERMARLAKARRIIEESGSSVR